MRVRVLGCSGAIARDCKTTSFLIDQDTLIDAGTGVGDLTREEMLRIHDVFLTHSHLDHVACLPLMVDTIAAARAGQPLRVHALPETIAAMRQHIFNDVIWPDFTRIPAPDAPFVRFVPFATGQTITVGHKTIEVLPAEHTVPAVGFSVCAGGSCWVFTGDTGPNPALWARVNQLPVHALVIETAFGNQDETLAQVSQHLSPRTLALELNQIHRDHRYPIYITHTKPSQTGQIMGEVVQHDSATAHRRRPHDIRDLQAGQEWQI